MKKQIIPGCVIMLLALVIAAGSVSFLQPCVHEDGTVGACYWAGRSLLGLGLLLLAFSFLAVLLQKFRAGLYLSIVIACILGMLTPGTLISICGMDTMRCRMLMRPAMLILFGVALLVALVGWLTARKVK